MDLEVQMSWQAQHFVNLEPEIERDNFARERERGLTNQGGVTQDK